MSESNVTTKSGTNFTAIDIGSFENLDQYVFRLPSLSREVPGKLFVNQLLGLTSSEISINTMPIGGGMPFHHKHKLNEEIYIFLSGEGQFQIDDEIFPIKQGSVIRVAPAAVRCWRNTGTTNLLYIVIQAREGSYTGHTTQDGEGVNKPVTW